jgi:hypothetical protein
MPLRSLSSIRITLLAIMLKSSGDLFRMSASASLICLANLGDPRISMP